MSEAIETKKDATKLFKKLFVKASRTRSNWKGMLASLVTDKEITDRQGHKWYNFGQSPTV